jgi:hypothetical protein
VGVCLTASKSAMLLSLIWCLSMMLYFLQCSSLVALSSKSLFFFFFFALGLKVNLAKSDLILVGDVDQIGDILGYGVAILPVKYLGLPLGASYKSIHIRDGVIEKIERRLANWKMLYLSKGVRVTLIKSTLANLPTYFFSFSSPGKCRCLH